MLCGRMAEQRPNAGRESPSGGVAETAGRNVRVLLLLLRVHLLLLLMLLNGQLLLLMTGLVLLFRC